MWRAFVWLSGADPEILARCKNLSRSERIRFAGLGSLVVIPAVLGFVGMSYAVSTVSSEPIIYFGAGAAWGAAVAAIDRYLLSTLYRSRLKNRGRVGAVAARLIFAVLVGIAVSHPLVLLWFDDSITQHIDSERREAVAVRLKEADGAKAAARESAGQAKASIQVTSYGSAISQATRRRNCLDRLLFAEQSGARVRLSCGASSGLPECAHRCETIRSRVENIDREIARLSARADRERSQGRAARRRIDADAATELARIDSDAAADVEEIKRGFSYDYLARVDALSQIEQDRPHVTAVRLFMILFFVFVDIMPVAMKLATQPGEYEEHRDTALLETQIRQAAEREVLATAGFVKEAVEAKVRHRVALDEIHALSDAVVDAVKLQSSQTLAFEAHVQDIRKAASRNGGANLHESLVAKRRHVVADALDKALERFEAYVRNS